MSETVSPRTGAFAAPAGRVPGARPVPLGYGLMIAVVLSAGLWLGISLAIFRLWL